MLTAKSSLVIGFCMFLNIFLHAQNLQITYQKSDSLFVCGSDTLFIQIQNQLNVPVSDGILTASLPPAIIYVAGSVQGANQLNINNLSNPSFSVPQIAPQQTRQIFLLLTANCQAANLIDAGQLFNAILSINSSAGNAQVVTNSIPVETGALVIESVTPTLLSGERGDTLFRTICFRNTRLGKIGNIHFEDEHQTGYDIFIENADSFTADSTLVKAEFAANLFQTTGNGDEWLDPEETICITERIIITDCGIPPVSRSSLLRSGWGCGSEWCRYDSLLTLVNILPSTKIPELSIQPLWSPPKDYCGEVAAEMGFLIHNIGHADAKNIVFNISLTEGFGEAGILPGSFKLVTSAGVQTIVPSLTTPMYLSACDKTPFKTANFVLPVVPKQDSIRFLFDVITCAAVCEQVQPAFKVDYFFQKECPINGSISGNSLILPEDGYVVFAEHSASLGDCMEAGESYPFHYQARGNYLLEDGYWHLKMVLPKSVTIDPTCGLLLDNQTPALFESSVDNQGQQLVHLAWETPLSSDTVDLDYCLKYTCDSNLICAPVIIDGEVVYTSACCFQSMTDVSYWGLTLQTPEQCGISDCNDRLLGVDNKCDPNGGGGGEFEVGAIPNVRIPGLKHWWMAYRQNPGWKDTQDDRKADLPLSVASSQWRKDRFLAGDTLRVEFCGTVDTLIQIDSIYYTVWNEVVASDLAINGNDIFVTETAQNGFTDTSKIILIETLVRIKYANGLEETCSWNGSYAKKGGVYIRLELPNTFPPQAIDEVCSMHHNFLFSLPDMMGAGCISKPYLEIGDSVFIYNDYKINTNFKPASGNLPDPALVGFRTALNIGGGLVAWDNIASAKMQYSGWQLNRSPNTHTIKPCATSTEVKKFRYSLRIARENMFPFEVRPLGWISDYYQTCPQGLELQSARLEYLTLQDSLPWLSNISLPFAHTPEFLNIDFAPAFIDPLDEGFTLKTNLTFKPNCLYNLPDTSIQFVETSFQGCLNGDKMTRFDSIINPIGFYANTPRITLITNDSVVNSPTRAFELEITLENALVSPAPFAWMYIESPSGLVSQLELFQMPQNQSIAGNNGFFPLNHFNGISSRNFRIKGLNQSCDTDSLRIYFGWTCNPIQKLDQASCSIDTTIILLNLERPELELDVLHEPDQIPLCTESDWFEFEVFNAKNGYAYALESSLRLPPGLKIAPGSCQISYPEGSPWINIPDPTETSSNFYKWQISALLPAVSQNGLPGFNLEPENTFKIRFKVLAECGFVSNTPIVYGATGTEPCGRQANVLNKLGEPLNIVGVTPSYGVQINIQPIGNLADGCGEIQEFEVNMQLLGTPSSTDSVYVSLPQGVHILPTSYLPGTNAPSGPLVINMQGFQLPLPILQGGGPVSFRFKVSYDGIAGCSDKLIQVQTRVRTEAFCASLGAPCVVYVATGESVWNINVEHPTLVITSADFSLSNGETYGEVTITNTGDITTHWAEVYFYYDVNTNGAVDAGDVLLGSFIQNASGLLLPGESITMEGAIPGLDSQFWCNVMIVLPAYDNCLCSDQIYQPEQWQIAHTELKFCALEQVQLGIPGQSGYTYQWQANSGISCLTCPTITFTPDSSINLNTPIELVLTETNGNCIVRHTFLLSFSTIAGIIASDQIVCKGQPIVLSAIPTTGDTYFWTGSGIVNPSLATQTILAQSSSTYAVTISFTNGCTASKTIDILVLTPDTTLLSELITCQGVPVDILGNVTDTPGTYQLLLSNGQGCDSLVFQSLALSPPVQTVENFTFCLGDTLKNVLDTFFTTSGQVCRTFQGLNGCDSVHCAIITAIDPPDFPVQDTLYVDYGQIITLTGPSGFESYWWIPAPVPPCEDCQEVDYPADSVAYQEFRLQVTDANGCSGELVFRVLVLPPCSADSLHIPNAFTPNGDGANDVFRVVPHEGSEVISSLEIYNRWGQKVYENFGDSSWDGTINGQPASSDVYVYIVSVKCGELVGKRVGDVTLLR